MAIKERPPRRRDRPVRGRSSDTRESVELRGRPLTQRSEVVDDQTGLSFVWSPGSSNTIGVYDVDGEYLTWFQITDYAIDVDPRREGVTWNVFLDAVADFIFYNSEWIGRGRPPSDPEKLKDRLQVYTRKAGWRSARDVLETESGTTQHARPKRMRKQQGRLRRPSESERQRPRRERDDREGAGDRFPRNPDTGDQIVDPSQKRGRPTMGPLEIVDNKENLHFEWDGNFDPDNITVYDASSKEYLGYFPVDYFSEQPTREGMTYNQFTEIVTEFLEEMVDLVGRGRPPKDPEQLKNRQRVWFPANRRERIETSRFQIPEESIHANGNGHRKKESQERRPQMREPEEHLRRAARRRRPDPEPRERPRPRARARERASEREPVREPEPEPDREPRAARRQRRPDPPRRRPDPERPSPRQAARRSSRPDPDDAPGPNPRARRRIRAEEDKKKNDDDDEDGEEKSEKKEKKDDKKDSSVKAIDFTAVFDAGENDADEFLEDVQAAVNRVARRHGIRASIQ